MTESEVDTIIAEEKIEIAAEKLMGINRYEVLARETVYFSRIIKATSLEEVRGLIDSGDIKIGYADRVDGVKFEISSIELMENDDGQD